MHVCNCAVFRAETKQGEQYSILIALLRGTRSLRTLSAT